MTNYLYRFLLFESSLFPDYFITILNVILIKEIPDFVVVVVLTRANKPYSQDYLSQYCINYRMMNTTTLSNLSIECVPLTIKTHLVGDFSLYSRHLCFPICNEYKTYKIITMSFVHLTSNYLSYYRHIICKMLYDCIKSRI